MEDFYIYNLLDKVINSLELLYFDSKTSESVKADEPPKTSQPPPNQHDTEYYKSDLYRYNLKRKLNGLPPVTEQQFDKLLEEESIESLSGSDDESDDEDKLQHLIQKLDVKDDDNDDESTVSHLNTKSPFILFGSPLVPADKAIGVYKAVFSPSQLDNPTESLHFPKTGKSALFMIGGGHFAGAIISHTRKNTRGNAPTTKESIQEQAVDIIQSKTFHRYTTRRKQGGSQSASDNARGKANSAGSSIRRYNEQALIQEVRELLHDWKNQLAECTAIYIRANGASNRKVLVGEGSPIQANDPRLRGFPFTTRRATTSELKRAWVELTHLHVVDMPKVEKKKETPKRIEKTTVSPPPPPTNTLSTDLITLLKKQKAPKLINFVKQNSIDVNEFRLDYTHTPTLLHYAAANGLGHMVQVLLVNLKANPIVYNAAGRTPAEVADTSARKVFQIVRHKLGEEYCDWNAAKVAPPKSKEEIEQEERTLHEQLELEKKQLIQQELTKPEPKKVTPSFDLTGLSDQQKMRVLREQRARAAEARMKR